MSGSGVSGSSRRPLLGLLNPSDQGEMCRFDPSTSVRVELVQRLYVAIDRLEALRATGPGMMPKVEREIAGLRSITGGGAEGRTLVGSDVFQRLYGVLAVRVAESYLNVREVRDAKGETHNSGEEVEEFLEQVGKKAGASWCAAFAYTCHARAAKLLGGHTTMPKSALASDLWVKSRQLNARFTVDAVFKGVSFPRAGDVFVFEQRIDTEKRAKDDRDKAIHQAKLARSSKGKFADKAAGGDDSATRQNQLEEEYRRAVKSAEEKYSKRTKGMTNGVMIGDNLENERRFWADEKTGASGSHTGVVRSFDISKKQIVTIEGNTSGGGAGSTDGDGVYLRTDRLATSGKGLKYPQMYGFVRARFEL